MVQRFQALELHLRRLVEQLRGASPRRCACPGRFTSGNVPQRKQHLTSHNCNGSEAPPAAGLPGQCASKIFKVCKCVKKRVLLVLLVAQSLQEYARITFCLLLMGFGSTVLLIAPSGRRKPSYYLWSSGHYHMSVLCLDQPLGLDCFSSRCWSDFLKHWKPWPWQTKRWNGHLTVSQCHGSDPCKPKRI